MNELETKLINFLLTMTQPQSQWLQDVRTVNWTGEDPKQKTWQLFAEAHIHGIRHSVAYPLVKAVVKKNNVTITDQELSQRAHMAFQKPQSAPKQPNIRPLFPTSIIKPK